MQETEEWPDPWKPQSAPMCWLLFSYQCCMTWSCTSCPQDETEALQEMKPTKRRTQTDQTCDFSSFKCACKCYKAMTERTWLQMSWRWNRPWELGFFFPSWLYRKNIKLFLYLIKGLKSTPSSFPCSASLWFVIQRDRTPCGRKIKGQSWTRS